MTEVLNILRQLISLSISFISTFFGSLNIIFPLVVAIGIFLLALSDKDKLAIKIMVFLIPFEFYFPLRDSYNLEIAINGFFIWAIWLAMQIKNFNKSNQSIVDHSNNSPGKSPNILWLYYFLFVGIFLGILNFENNLDYFSAYVLVVAPEIQIMNVSLFILTTIMFVQIMYKYKNDYEFQQTLLKIFLATSFLHLLSIIIAFGYLGNNSNRILSMFSSFKTSINPFAATFADRYSGLLNDYEMIIDYCMIIIVFGLISIKKFKIISLAAIAASSIVAIFSGTRSFIVALIIFFGGVIFLNIFRTKLTLKYTFFLTILIFISYITYNQYLSALPIFYRYETAIQLIQMGDYVAATNRNFIEEVPLILRNVGILGNGSFYFWNIGNYSLVSHNLLLAMYAKFGIIGVVSILILFYKSAIRLFSILKKANLKFHDEAALLIALLIALFIQQMKISFIRSLSTILIYALFFIFLHFFIYRADINEQSNLPFT